MKKINKILPILGAVAVGAIPFATTGCSKVWTDLLEKQYTPSYTPASKGKDGLDEITILEAKDIFQDYFLQHESDLIPDFYWGASFFGKEGIPAWEGNNVKTFLMQLSNMSIKKGTDTSIIHAPLLSYHSKAQLEIKDPGLAGSYAINTYDLDWEFNNIAVIPVHYASLKGNECWSLSPVKFDSYNSFWWRELEGDEQIKFDFKAVFKGYGKNGGQNYVRETSEAAVIDEAHKYAPELNEIYTNIMLFDSYYLSKLKPRMVFEGANVLATWDEAEQCYKSGDLTFTLGANTYEKYKDATLTFSVLDGSMYVYSPFESGITEDDITLQLNGFKGETISPTISTDRKYKFNPSFTIAGGKKPETGDRLYYVIKMECKKPASKTELVNWTEYLFVSTLISSRE